jgi:hypothetical protein
MSYSRKTTFEDLSSEVHISIFEYLNANQLVESFFDLNQYFKQLLCNHHLLLHCALIDEQNNIDILLSNVCLQQLKSLKCYDYNLIQFDNPNELSCLHSLVVFKYATNIREEIIIDFILGISHLKYCQIRMSQSHGQITLASPYYHQSEEQCSSNLEGLDIDSKSGLPFSYFCSHVLPRLPHLRYLNVYLSCRDGNRKILYESIDPLTYLSKLTLKITSANLEHLYLLAQMTPNLQYLKLDYSAGNSAQSFLDATSWFQFLSSWKNIRVLSIYAQAKNNVTNNHHFQAIQQTFRSIPFLVERHLCPFYADSYKKQRIHFHGYY